MDRLWKITYVTLILAIIAGAVMLILNPRKTTEIKVKEGYTNTENRFGIFGAVHQPGYYSSSEMIRIDDAVRIAGGLTNDADVMNAHLSKWVDDGETIIIPTAGAVQPTLTPIIEGEEKVDLNSADMSELMKLPGIGEKRAGDIIRLREEKGGFSSREEILEISGISEKLLESIYDRLIVR